MTRCRVQYSIIMKKRDCGPGGCNLFVLYGCGLGTSKLKSFERRAVFRGAHRDRSAQKALHDHVFRLLFVQAEGHQLIELLAGDLADGGLVDQ